MNIMVKRKLVYFNPAQAPELLPKLSAAGWEVYLESDMARIRGLISEYKILTGLAHFETLKGQFSRIQIECLFPLDSSIEWLALVSPDFMQPSESFTLIARYFFDYHTLPVDLQRLLITLGHAYGMAHARQALKAQENGGLGKYKMIGASPAMSKLFRDIKKLAGVEAPVLITGESGTGKELAAHAIHEQSNRFQGPFVTVNCAALPASLIQSELFGYERGAFTGAIHRKIGCIESAAGGTVFLDEIGDLSPELQGNLLRFLQEKKIRRIGGAGEIPVDARVIAATHVDLEKAVKEGRFRDDLYYRLNVLHTEIPALREREGDIDLLVRFFFDQFSGETRCNVKGFTQEALQVMRAYSWPGNVRELINRVRRAGIMGEKRFITPADLGLERRISKRRPSPPLITLDEARGEAEKEIVLSTLHYTGNNVSMAARELNISRITLYRLIEKYGISLS